jgi:hypothetical protein
MTLENLIDLLTDLRDEHGGECEVRTMTQNSWPFENAIQGLCTSVELGEGLDEADDLDERDREGGFTPADREDGEEDCPVVYLVEGRQLGYGTKEAWQHAYSN